MVRASRLRFFGHVAWAHPTEVHRRAIQAAMQKTPSSWERPQGRPSLTWLRVVADDELRHPYRLTEGSRPNGIASRHGHSNAPEGVGYEARKKRRERSWNVYMWGLVIFSALVFEIMWINRQTNSGENPIAATACRRSRQQVVYEKKMILDTVSDSLFWWHEDVEHIRWKDQ